MYYTPKSYTISCRIPVISIHLQVDWNKVWILIKPADLKLLFDLILYVIVNNV